MKRTRLDVIAGSAAYDATPEPRIEVMLVGVGEVWDFEIGPVAARTFAMLLLEAAERLERRIGAAAVPVASDPHDSGDTREFGALAPGSAENTVGRGRPPAPTPGGGRIAQPPRPITDDPKDTGRRERRG